MKTLFLDEYGHTRMGWVLLTIGLGCCALLVVMVFSVKMFYAEPACNQIGNEYGMSADFRFPADVCFVELPNGKKINADNLQGFEGVER